MYCTIDDSRIKDMKPDLGSPGGDSQSQSTPPSNSAPRQEAAANIIRSQIDSIYGGSPVATPKDSPSTEEAPNPYQRTLTSRPEPQEDEWKKYHSAWQNYYQKYYENYYSHHANDAKSSAGYFSSSPVEQKETTSEEELTNDEALFELRQKLLGKVHQSAKKIRRSRHFVPIVAALVVVLVFVFLQYNRNIVGTVRAYVTPGNIDPQNIVIDPSSDIAVGSEPRLIIPKINVDVPVHYDVGNDHNSQMAAMAKGLAHFSIPGANSHPGEVGNTVIAGHSSNDVFDTGDYKFIFVQLEKLQIGDSIYANYKGKRYTYVVTKKEEVKPNRVDKLIYATDKPVMTLITCTPIGTALNRLLVTAEQVSPDPTKASPAPKTGDTDEEAVMPGNAPTFLERIFGGGN